MKTYLMRPRQVLQSTSTECIMWEDSREGSVTHMSSRRASSVPNNYSLGRGFVFETRLAFLIALQRSNTESMRGIFLLPQLGTLMHKL